MDELPQEQIDLLKKAFDAFDREKNGWISTEMVGTILEMLGTKLDQDMLDEIIAEVDEDASGELEFPEFCTLAARFLVEEDAEAMQQELREAFRLYDKEGFMAYGGAGWMARMLAERKEYFPWTPEGCLVDGSFIALSRQLQQWHGSSSLELSGTACGSFISSLPPGGGNGYITTNVLREILAELDDKLTSEELDAIIEEIDSDGSGTVDFEEFMEVMTGE